MVQFLGPVGSVGASSLLSWPCQPKPCADSQERLGPDAIVTAMIFATLRDLIRTFRGPSRSGMNVRRQQTNTSTSLGDCFRWVRRRQVKGVARWDERNDGCEPGFVTARNDDAPAGRFIPSGGCGRSKSRQIFAFAISCLSSKRCSHLSGKALTTIKQCRPNRFHSPRVVATGWRLFLKP
jgi:hypothetical protein